MTAPDLSMAQISRRMLSAKAEQFTESVIREMTRLALKHGAVNLSQGFPDFAAPEEIKEAARQAISDNINQYAITWGAKSLRDAIAEKFERTQGVKYDPEREITICCGSTGIDNGHHGGHHRLGRAAANGDFALRIVLDALGALELLSNGVAQRLRAPGDGVLVDVVANGLSRGFLEDRKS